ncbi:beta/alpha barrel domain-containing protein [Saccharomonospora iraqiensis]|uniref:hypothetical protein n=1 Tax=Saccharomonospora iraqiensis TaxID=52698 RepID=UPI0004129BDC|nr:hypothetical protein [Saccharomonospora iraqiensis]
MTDEQPAWARRIRSLRRAHSWSQVAAVCELRRHADAALPSTEHLVRRWKDWESGKNRPSDFYAPLIAATLGTVTSALFPPEGATPAITPESEVLTATGMDTLELLTRLRSSDIDDTTLDAVRITVEKLCCDYSRRPPRELLVESRKWLRRLVDMRWQRLTFAQHRSTLELAGWLALVVGCLEYDLGDPDAAEATRRSALSLGEEVGSADILGWAHEMRAWFALTRGDYRSALAAGRTGEAVAGARGVSVQLVAQQAKAYARMGLRDEMRRALARGRAVLEALPYPDRIDNHFVVDPSKFDFYAMDCYRTVGEDRLARELSDEVARVSTGAGHGKRWPMRLAEARLTRAVVAARDGDLDHATTLGHRALEAGRRSLPSLLMVSGELATTLTHRFPTEPSTRDYLDALRSVRQSTR